MVRREGVVWAYMVVSHFAGPVMFELGELSHSSGGGEFGVCEVIIQKSLLLLHMSFIEEQFLKLFRNICAVTWELYVWSPCLSWLLYSHWACLGSSALRGKSQAL